MNLAENKYGHGAKRINPIHRKVNRIMRGKIGRASIPFDWNKGYDVRDIIGPISIKNQGLSSSCSGQAGAYFIEIQRRLQNIKEGAISAKSIYSPIAFSAGGTTIVALESQIGSIGANLESEVPSYYLNGEPFTESMMTERSWETDSITRNALTRAGYTPYDIPNDIDSIAEATRDCGASLWEIEGQNNGTWLLSNPQPPSKTNPNSRWWHFMCIIGAKMINGQKTLIVLNSWGTSVGQNGEQHFTQNYFDAKGIIDAFTMIYDTRLIPTSDNHSVWAELNRWFRLFQFELKP